MFFIEMPDVPPQYQQVMLVQAAQSPQTKAQYDRLVGVCHPIESVGMAPSAVNSMEPVGSLKDYFYSQEKKTLEGPSTVTVLEQPKHGTLKDNGTFVIDADTRVRTDTGERRYRYLPNPGYVTGQDRAVLLVEIAGLKVKMVYTFHVVDVLDDESDEIFCPSPYERLPDEQDNPLAAQV